MKVVFVAAECAPFAKVGGLGDVVGTLPEVLVRLGHSVRVIVPHHGAIDDARHNIEPCDTFQMDWNGSRTTIEIAHAARNGVPTYFVRGWPFFTASESFIYSPDEGIDVGRFLFLAAASLKWVKRLAKRDGWVPDLFHIHDWHTALVPYLLRRVYATDPMLGKASTLFTIHNMNYQGWGIGWHLQRAGLPGVDHPLLNAIGRANNCLAIGLAYSTSLSTVSSRYRDEILSPEGGFGLDGLLHARSMRLTGILNGIDTVRWNPATSQAIAAPYDIESLERKAENKRALQAELKLSRRRKNVPVVGAVMRLVEQKGTTILIPAIRHMLHHAEMQFVVVGTGDASFEMEMRRIGVDYPRKAAIYIGFDEGLSEQVYAGADMFVMPSVFEPCGIGQMIAMRYGTLPVVREVGGLADTVSPDVGFRFNGYSPEGLQSALSDGLYVYYNDRTEWETRQRRAMQQDHSWEKSARRYIEVYEETVQVHRKYH